MPQTTTHNMIDKVIRERSQIRIPLGEKQIGINKKRTGEVVVTSLPYQEVGISLWVAEQMPISIDGRTHGTTKVIRNKTYTRSVKTKTLKDNTARFLFSVISEGKSKVRGE